MYEHASNGIELNGCDMSHCVSLQHKANIVRMWSAADGSGILSISADTIRYHSRGGLLQNEFKINNSNASSTSTHPNGADHKSTTVTSTAITTKTEADTFIRTATPANHPNKPEIVLSLTRPALSVYDISANTIVRTT